MAASKTNEHNKIQFQRHFSVHFSTSFTKAIVHSEVLEEIESSFRGEDLFKSTNQKQELPVAAMFVKNRDKMFNLYRGSPIDASYQVSVHLAMRFQRGRFSEIDQPETRTTDAK